MPFRCYTPYHVHHYVIILNKSLFPDCASLDGTIRVPGDGSELEGWHSDSAGSSSTPESQMMDSLALASRSGDVTGALSRIKRGVLFPSGVKLCSQETVKQALQNHLDYFHLRGEISNIWCFSGA